MTVVLALDTATLRVSVAVMSVAELNVAGRTDVDDARVWATQVAAGRATGALLPGAVTEVMAQAGLRPQDLSAIAVGVGPGPYTSLRVGLMFARAAGAALGIPVVGACSLDIVARGLDQHMVGELGLTAGVRAGAGDVIVALDARRREVYWARYNAAGVRTMGPFVGKPATVAADHPGVAWCADETPQAGVLAKWATADRLVTTCADVVEDDPNGVGGPHAVGGSWVPQTLLAPEPLYLRRPDVMEPLNPLPGVMS